MWCVQCSNTEINPRGGRHCHPHFIGRAPLGHRSHPASPRWCTVEPGLEPRPSDSGMHTLDPTLPAPSRLPAPGSLFLCSSWAMGLAGTPAPVLEGFPLVPASPWASLLSHKYSHLGVQGSGCRPTMPAPLGAAHRICSRAFQGERTSLEEKEGPQPAPGMVPHAVRSVCAGALCQPRRGTNPPTRHLPS